MKTGFARNEGHGVHMVRLTIYLRDGFVNDTVMITVNGREVYRKSNLSTRNQIGRADLVNVDADEGTSVVEVLVPSKGVSRRLEIKDASRPFIAVRLTDAGAMELKESSEPFNDM